MLRIWILTTFCGYYCVGAIGSLVFLRKPGKLKDKIIHSNRYKRIIAWE